MGLTSAGLDTPTLPEIKAEIDAQIRATISDRVDLSADSPAGQIVTICARQIRKVWETLEAVYAAMDPLGATGVTLRRLAALTGTYPRAATFSTVTATVNADPGTYAPGALVAYVTGRPEDRFVNSDAVVNGGGSAANFAVAFRAEVAGPVQAPSGTLVERVPVAGWNSVTNSADAVAGLDAETDPELRARRIAEIDTLGSARVEAIRSDLLQVDGVLQAFVIENDTESTIDGVPPLSIEAVVYGPASPSAADDTAVAEAIFNSKAGGVRTHGTEVETVVDDQGFSHSIRFTRASLVPVALEIELTYQEPDYPGNAAINAKIVERAAAFYRAGYDVTPSKISAWCHEVAGVLSVDVVRTGDPGGPFSATAYAIDIREIAQISAGDIDVSSSPGVP
jgi:uncharacterized phage protein gp47/JayE